MNRTPVLTKVQTEALAQIIENGTTLVTRENPVNFEACLALVSYGLLTVIERRGDANGYSFTPTQKGAAFTR